MSLRFMYIIVSAYMITSIWPILGPYTLRPDGKASSTVEVVQMPINENKPEAASETAEPVSPEQAAIKEYREAYDRYRRRCIAYYDPPVEHQIVVKTLYKDQVKEVYGVLDEWRECVDIYDQCQLGDCAYLRARIDAVADMKRSGARFTYATYDVDKEVAAILKSSGHDDESYKKCFGNQLQQVMHRECLDLLVQVASPSTLLTPVPQEAIVDCIDAVREYNQSGLVRRASQVADMCWAVINYSKIVWEKVASGVQEIVLNPLDYSKAVAEGGWQGLRGAVADILHHPIQTAVCVIAGEYVLAYQLSKVAVNLLDISLTTIVDRSRGKEKWDNYIAPISETINAITDKQVTLRDAIKNGTALAVGWKAQSKLFSGLGKLYASMQDKVVDFAKNNLLITAEEYAMTADGMLLKAADNAKYHENHHVAKKAANDVKSGTKSAQENQYGKICRDQKGE